MIWERWQWMDTPYSPKLQHYWNLTIRLSCVISRTLIEVVLPLCRDAVGVFYSPSRLGNDHMPHLIRDSIIKSKLYLESKLMCLALLQRNISRNCYIIKEWFFYFNNFSLIIFYHSVCLGFELFGLRAQVHSIGYTIRSCAKDLTITFVIIKQDRKRGWGVGDVMPRRDGLRIWGFQKSRHLRVDIGPCRQRIEFSDTVLKLRLGRWRCSRFFSDLYRQRS